MEKEQHNSEFVPLPHNEKDRLMEESNEDSEKIKIALGKFSYYKKPFEQWSDEEKKEFSEWAGRFFNNFYGGDINSALNISTPIVDDNVPMWKKRFGNYPTPEAIQEAINRTSDSKKFLFGTKAEFIGNIRKALLKNNIDSDYLLKILKRKSEIREIFYENNWDYSKTPDVVKENFEITAYFYVSAIPVIFDLLEEGYKLTELRR